MSFAAFAARFPFREPREVATLPPPADLTPVNGCPVWGVVPPKPFRTGVPGRIRVRMRNNEFAEAFVRHQGSTRRFIVFDAGDHWVLPADYEQGRNA